MIYAVPNILSGFRILAAALPNGLRAGERLRLNGQSLFEFKDGKMFRLAGAG